MGRIGIPTVILEGFTDASTILRAGVYALVYRSQVVYVGKSKNMLTRVYTHKSMWSAKRSRNAPKWIPIKGVLFDEVHIQPCSLELIDSLEQAMIARYRPKYNIKHNGEAPTRSLGPIPIKVNGIALIIGGTPKPKPAFERRI